MFCKKSSIADKRETKKKTKKSFKKVEYWEQYWTRPDQYKQQRETSAKDKYKS